MKILLWTETAKTDLQHIYDYISEDSIFYANKFVDDLIIKVDNIVLFPNSGRIVPEINRKDIREILYNHVNALDGVASRSQIAAVFSCFWPLASCLWDAGT